MLWERQLLHNEPQTERDEAKCCNLKLQKGAGLQYQIFIHTKLNRLYILFGVLQIFLKIIVLKKTCFNISVKSLFKCRLGWPLS